MARKRHGAEEIITKIREAELMLSKGKRVPQACKKIGVTEQTYYRWRKEYGGLKLDQAKRLKELEKENARLKKLVADAPHPGLRRRPGSWRSLPASPGSEGCWWADTRQCRNSKNLPPGRSAERTDLNPTVVCQGRPPAATLQPRAAYRSVYRPEF